MHLCLGSWRHGENWFNERINSFLQRTTKSLPGRGERSPGCESVCWRTDSFWSGRGADLCQSWKFCEEKPGRHSEEPLGNRPGAQSLCRTGPWLSNLWLMGWWAAGASDRSAGSRSAAPWRPLVKETGKPKPVLPDRLRVWTAGLYDISASNWEKRSLLNSWDSACADSSRMFTLLLFVLNNKWCNRATLKPRGRCWPYLIWSVFRTGDPWTLLVYVFVLFIIVSALCNILSGKLLSMFSN